MERISGLGDFVFSCISSHSVRSCVTCPPSSIAATVLDSAGDLEDENVLSMLAKMLRKKEESGSLLTMESLYQP